MKTSVLTIALTFIVLLVGMRTDAAPEQKGLPVTIALEGTTVDQLPQYVDMITDKPAALVTRLVRLGGRRIEDDEVRLKGIAYHVRTPDALFKSGDVMYAFRVENEAQREEFVQRHKLHQLSANDHRVYRASSGHYVSVWVVPTTVVYSCAMHPQIRLPKADKCPICGMQLTKQTE